MGRQEAVVSLRLRAPSPPDFVFRSRRGVPAQPIPCVRVCTAAGTEVVRGPSVNGRPVPRAGELSLRERLFFGPGPGPSGPNLRRLAGSAGPGPDVFRAEPSALALAAAASLGRACAVERRAAERSAVLRGRGGAR